MTISVGDRLPAATLTEFGENGPQPVDLEARLKGRKVVIFAVPGAFTTTCHTAHVPSFVRTRDAFAEKGIDEIICLSVNDVFVMKAWGEATGATNAGIAMVADPVGDFTRAIGMDFDAPAVGLMGRSKRYAMMVDDGVVQVFQPELSPGTCELSGGEGMLAAIEGK